MPVAAGSLCSWLAVSALVGNVLHTWTCRGGNPPVQCWAGQAEVIFY